MKPAIFTTKSLQNIKQEINVGRRKIEIGYYFSETPSNVFDARIGFTQNARVSWDSDEPLDKQVLVDHMYEKLCQDIPYFFETVNITVVDGDPHEPEEWEDEVIVGLVFDEDAQRESDLLNESK